MTSMTTPARMPRSGHADSAKPESTKPPTMDRIPRKMAPPMAIEP